MNTDGSFHLHRYNLPGMPWRIHSTHSLQDTLPSDRSQRYQPVWSASYPKKIRCRKVWHLGFRKFPSEFYVVFGNFRGCFCFANPYFAPFADLTFINNSAFIMRLNFRRFWTLYHLHAFGQFFTQHAKRRSNLSSKVIFLWILFFIYYQCSLSLTVNSCIILEFRSLFGGELLFMRLTAE